MNNYANVNEYSYMNLYNQNSVSNKMNDVNKSLYDPYNGFIRGNMYKNLYDPYKRNEPYEIRPMNEQAELLTYIDALCFAMIDLNLYLDVCPGDKNVINLFNQYRNEKEELTKDYESKYGPIGLDSDSLNSYPWAWNNMPWPWEN